jgi:hypothetical protein
VIVNTVAKQQLEQSWTASHGMKRQRGNMLSRREASDEYLSSSSPLPLPLMRLKFIVHLEKDS